MSHTSDFQNKQGFDRLRSRYVKRAKFLRSAKDYLHAIRERREEWNQSRADFSLGRMLGAPTGRPLPLPGTETRFPDGRFGPEPLVEKWVAAHTAFRMSNVTPAALESAREVEIVVSEWREMVIE